MHLRKVLGREGFKLPEGAGWTVLGQRGGKDDWEKNWQVRLDATAPELLKIIDDKLSEGWTRVSSANERGGAKTLWKFADDEGKQWTASAVVEPTAEPANSFHLRISLARTESASR